MQTKMPKNIIKSLILATLLLSLASLTNIGTAGAANTTFTRSGTAYQLNGVQVPSNTPRYENGGILLEAATTNLIGAASDAETFPGNLNCWSTAGSILFSQDTTQHWQGSASAKLTNTYNGSQSIIICTDASVSGNTSYTFSVHAKTSLAKNTTYLAMQWFDTNWNLVGTYHSPGYTTTPTSWTRLKASDTAPSNAVYARCHLIIDDMPYNAALWWDGAQLEQKPYATSWQISGTTRNSEYLTIPTAGILNANQGTLELKVYIDPNNAHSASSDSWTMPFSMVDVQGSQETNQISIRRIPNTVNWQIFFTSNSAAVSAVFLGDITTPGWYSIAATWQSGVGGYGYLNGVQKGSVAASYLPVTVAPSTATIGDWAGGGGNSIGSVISDLRISNRARSAAEIQTAYQSGKPLPLDANTTLKLPLNGSLNGTENAIIYNYDQANRLNGVNAPQSSASYQYDNNGNLLRRQ